MIIADKYEITSKISFEGDKGIIVTFKIPRLLRKEESGIVEQFFANSLYGIIDDFPLD